MISKKALSLLLICSTITINAGWINTDQVAQDITNAWESIKESPDKIRSKINNAIEKASNSFEISEGRTVHTSVENNDQEVAFLIKGVSKDEVEVTILDDTLRIAIAKKK